MIYIMNIKRQTGNRTPKMHNTGEQAPLNNACNALRATRDGIKGLFNSNPQVVENKGVYGWG